MSKKMYEEELIRAFETVKETLSEGKRVPVLIEKNNYSTKPLVRIAEYLKFDEIKVGTISLEAFSHCDYIWISGVYLLYLITSNYLRLNNVPYHTYKYDDKTQRIIQKCKLLRSSVFIFEETSNSLKYYKIKELHQLGEIFKFDLPKLIIEKSEE